ncbi:hypothetical protein OSTOST_14431 [Ostertagia ostertagi]
MLVAFLVLPFLLVNIEAESLQCLELDKLEEVITKAVGPKSLRRPGTKYGCYCVHWPEKDRDLVVVQCVYKPA